MIDSIDDIIEADIETLFGTCCIDKYIDGNNISIMISFVAWDDEDEDVIFSEGYLDIQLGEIIDIERGVITPVGIQSLIFELEGLVKEFVEEETSLGITDGYLVQASIYNELLKTFPHIYKSVDLES